MESIPVGLRNHDRSGRKRATGVVVPGGRLGSGLALVAPLNLGSLTTLIKHIRPHLYLDGPLIVSWMSEYAELLGSLFLKPPHVSQNLFHPFAFWISLRYKRVVYVNLISN